jgi:hypothetical protein
MDLVDGEHFNYEYDVITDEEAKMRAKNSFVDMIKQINDENELEDWVEVEIVEEKS